jgi:hypothetical protein
VYQPATYGAFFPLLLACSHDQAVITGMFLFKCSLLDTSRFGRTQPWTNDPGQVSLPHMPSSNARWQLPSVLACFVPYRCRQPLDLPNIGILILLSGKGPQSVDSSCYDLRLRICSSSLPGHLTCSDAIDKVHFLSFLGSWFRLCLLQASCIASCHSTGYCSPYQR